MKMNNPVRDLHVEYFKEEGQLDYGNEEVKKACVSEEEWRGYTMEGFPGPSDITLCRQNQTAALLALYEIRGPGLFFSDWDEDMQVKFIEGNTPTLEHGIGMCKEYDEHMGKPISACACCGQLGYYSLWEGRGERGGLPPEGEEIGFWAPLKDLGSIKCRQHYEEKFERISDPEIRKFYNVYRDPSSGMLLHLDHTLVKDFGDGDIRAPICPQCLHWTLRVKEEKRRPPKLSFANCVKNKETGEVIYGNDVGNTEHLDPSLQMTSMEEQCVWLTRVFMMVHQMFAPAYQKARNKLVSHCAFVPHPAPLNVVEGSMVPNMIGVETQFVLLGTRASKDREGMEKVYRTYVHKYFRSLNIERVKFWASRLVKMHPLYKSMKEDIGFGDSYDEAVESMIRESLERSKASSETSGEAQDIMSSDIAGVRNASADDEEDVYERESVLIDIDKSHTYAVHSETAFRAVGELIKDSKNVKAKAGANAMNEFTQNDEIIALARRRAPGRPGRPGLTSVG